MTLAAKPFAAAVNHLLARESWARERLAPYAGKTARLSCPPVVLMLLVQPDGYLSAVAATAWNLGAAVRAPHTGRVRVYVTLLMAAVAIGLAAAIVVVLSTLGY